jgi:hypothetical protein
MAKSQKIKQSKKKMTLATIRKMAVKAGYIVLSLEEYNSITSRHFKTFKPTVAEKRAVIRAEKSYREGKLISWEDAKRQLGFKN